MPYNMKTSPHFYPCRTVLVAHFSNLTKFEGSSKRESVSYTYDFSPINANDLIMQSEKC